MPGKHSCISRTSFTSDVPLLSEENSIHSIAVFSGLPSNSALTLQIREKGMFRVILNLDTVFTTSSGSCVGEDD